MPERVPIPRRRLSARPRERNSVASSTVTRSSTELTDDVDETPLDDEDFDLDDEGDDDAD